MACPPPPTEPVHAFHRVVDWNDAFVLQAPEVDLQHRQLFDLINRLWCCAVACTPPEQVLPLLDELDCHTRTHFETEEVVMRMMEYPLLPEHRQAHQVFNGHIAAQRTRLLQGQGVHADAVRTRMDGLLEHILVFDKSYVAFCQLDRLSPPGVPPRPRAA